MMSVTSSSPSSSSAIKVESSSSSSSMVSSTSISSSDSGTLTPLLKRLEAAHLVKRTRSSEDERQVLIALTSQGHALKEKARAVPQSILAASDCSVSELIAMKDEIVALRDRLNAVIGE